ncbi:pentapeptide repeat-containing protein [Nostoc sp. UHCC 0702]|nr:pentapeptide repeat-containing protein [Nostoc sp. UHCC 0702]
MSENNTDTRRNSLIFIISLTVFALFIISCIFVGWFVWRISELNELLKNETEALKTTATIFGGIAVFINAYYAAKRWEAMDKSAEAANESAKAALKNAEAALKNAQVAEDKQITERFAKAIEQLGSEKIEVRLGAIYTLERIAKDSSKDHWTIMEVLTAFVRENAPLMSEEEKTDDTNEEPKLRTDIQAALTVIGRRNTEIEQANQRLDLHNIDIRRADLREANLQGANLYQANLQGAILTRANLQKADLMRANLQGAYLMGANPQGASLYQANLQGAYLMGANPQGANLYQANLQGADLYQANLQGVDLSEAENLEQQQINSAKGDRTTILPENLQRPEHWQ